MKGEDCSQFPITDLPPLANFDLVMSQKDTHTLELGKARGSDGIPNERHKHLLLFI
jgi:hypothetical protein